MPMKYLRGILIVFIGLNWIARAQEAADRDFPSQSFGVEFFKEEIILEVDDGQACITGVYYFRNNTDRELQMPVVFPFYVDSLCAYPDQIEAAVITEEGKTGLSYARLAERDMISLRIPIKAGGITSWRLTYQQELGANRAVYIITTTAAWKKPLEEATYYFIAPDSFSNIQTWPLPDTIYIEDGRHVFKSVRYDFMPQRDMEITWE